MKFTKQLMVLLVAAALLLTMVFGVLASTVTPASAATLSPVIMGDLDGNGNMTTTDARVYLKKLLAGETFTGTQKTIGDMNDDDEYSTADVRVMVQLVLQDTPSQAMRAMWIPYMEVEDLISSGKVSTTKSAIDACMTDCVARGANTVFFHVRANSDAYYDSSVFDPTWRTKTLLNSGFDPLAYAIESAHARGLELHAWVNPYRIGTDASRAKAEAVFSYSNRYYYVPSDADVQALVVSGVRELVEKYDIDGVQFDDYFYPTDSMSNTTPADFEQADYTAYKKAGGTMSIADWRRSAVNSLIAACYSVCHTKTDCVFGISPSYDFEANYNSMYADAATWAKTPGYVDYLAPQLYTGFEHQYAPYDEAIASWQTLPRLSTVDMVAGLALYKTGLLDDTWAGSAGRTEWTRNNDIMKRQIELAYDLEWDGIALYSHQSFEVGSDRNATVANADMASACEVWRVFN